MSTMPSLTFCLLAAVLASIAAHPTASGVVAGGETEKNPADYKDLAKESFEKYRTTLAGASAEIRAKEIKVTKATTQVVAGKLTRLVFTVTPSNGEDITCNSQLLERAWENVRELTVDCDFNKEATRSKRDSVVESLGGVSEENPEKPEYKKLAQESFEKYRKTLTGGVINVTDITVTKVTTQVVSGSKTGIDFKVTPENGEIITCHSDILEQSWINKKEIDVNCQNN